MSLEYAIKMARSNTYVEKFKTAAVLKIGQSLFIGRNRFKTHPFAKRFNPGETKICLHAELSAILEAMGSGYRPPFGGRMYVARVLRAGSPALSKPCTGCQKAIVAFGIDDIEWTT